MQEVGVGIEIMSVRVYYNHNKTDWKIDLINFQQY